MSEALKFELEQALRTDDEERFVAALRAGADPNVPLWDGVHRPLYWAALRKWELLEPLVRAGARVSLEVDQPTTSIHIASAHPEPLKILLQADPGPVLNQYNEFGRSPLMLAESAECTRMLLEAGADPTAFHACSGTALHWAAMGRDVERVRLLLERGGNPLRSDGDYNAATPLALARQNEQAEGPLIQRLLEDAAQGPRRRKPKR